MPTSFYAVQNNTGSTVASPHTPGGTITLADASKFPASYPYRLSTFAPDGTPKSILAITGRTGNVLTTSGAIEGTTDVALSVGDLARLRVTAGALQDVHTAVNAAETTIAGYGNIVTHSASEFAIASDLTAHTTNTSNPHAVTAAQVGAYTTAQVDTLLTGKQAAGSYVPTTTTVAGHALSSNVTITPSDIGAQAAGTYITGTLVTSVGTPGSNTNVPSEAAVRSAISGAGGGTVSSVGLTMPTGFSVANSPVTTTGTLAVTTALSGYVKASGGAFTAGSIASGDIPDISSTYATVASLAGYVPTTRTVAGHALSADVTISASDVGAAPAAGSSSIVTVGTISTGTWHGSVIAPAYLGTGTPSSSNYLRGDGAWTAVSGGTAYDLLSPLTNAEISVTGAGALTMGRAHVCSGSSNYTVTLPSVTGNAGQSLLVRVASAATALITIDAGSGVTIDGTQTAILWAGESVILRCDGTNWSFGPSRRRAFSCTMRLSGSPPEQAQAVSASTATQVLLNATDSDPSGQMANTSTHVITIKRAGNYLVIACNLTASLAGAANRVIATIWKNGTAIVSAEGYGGTGCYPTPTVTKVLSLAAGDTIGSGSYIGGQSGYLYGDPTATSCYVSVLEVFS